MKILKPGKPKAWKTKATCTGLGHGGKGCDAKLLVEEADLFRDPERRGQTATFRCAICNALTDLRKRIPDHVIERLPASRPLKKLPKKANGVTLKKPAEANTHTLVYQEWEESERGWGTRPDGFSLHLDAEHHKKYVVEANKRQHEFYKSHGLAEGHVPDEYTRVSGDPVTVNVTKAIYDQVKKTDGNFRSYSRKIRPGPSRNLEGVGPKGLE